VCRSVTAAYMPQFAFSSIFGLFSFQTKPVMERRLQRIRKSVGIMGGDFTNPSSSRHAILAAIVRYVVKHPDAKDTVEGIRKWWRDPGEPEWSAADLEGVIHHLVQKNWLVVRDTAQDALFGANPAMLQEMLEFLSGTREK
jgi:hypothetical protein